MARNVERNLAGRIFQLKKQGAYLSPNLLASARRILENKNSEADVQAIRDFLGIARSGATSARAGMRAVSSGIAKAGHMATLAATVGQGGGLGLLAGLALTQQVSRAVEGWTKTRAFRDVIDRAMHGAGRLRGGALRSLAAKVADADLLEKVYRPKIKYDTLAKEAGVSLAGARPTMEIAPEQITRAAARRGRLLARTAQIAATQRMGYAAGRGMRTAGAVATGAVIGAAYAEAAFTIPGSARTGEAYQAAAREVAMGEATGEDEREMQMRRMRREKEESVSATRNIPLVGGATGSLLSRGINRRLGAMETEKLLRETGRQGQMNAIYLRSVAQERVLQDKYGFVGGLAAGRLNAMMKQIGISDAQLEDETTKKAEELLHRALEYNQAGRDLASRGILDAAQQVLNLASKEVPGVVPAWASPQNIWKAAETARQAEHWWAAQQMTRAGPRTGD